MPQPQWRQVTATVTMPGLSRYYLEIYAREFREFLKTPRPGYSFKNVPAGDRPCVAFMGAYWRVQVGGVVVSLRRHRDFAHLNVPTLPTRAQAIISIEDGQAARAALVLDGDKTFSRRTAWLIQTDDGNWMLRMVWNKKKTALIRGKPRQIRKHRRRWDICPPEWPRTPYGHPVTTQTARRMIGRAMADRLMGYPE